MNSDKAALDIEALSVSAAYVNTLLATVAMLGVQGAPSSSLLTSPADCSDSRVPASRFLAMLTDMAGQPGGEDIGLRMAEQSRPGTFSALGYAAMSCATLGEAAALIARYEDLVLDVGTTCLTLEAGVATLSWRAKHPALAIRPLHEAIVAGWFCFAQWVTGVSGIFPRKVCFTHPRPASVQAHIRLFGSEPEFSSPLNAVVFDAGLLQTPIAQVDHEFNRMMREKADALLAQLAVSGSLRQRVVAWLQSNLPRQQTTLAHAAQALAMSERTLRRRLADEHTSFQQLLTEVRVRLASLYLRDATLSLLDIALLLGYADQSAFTTAFRHWHGVTPGAWREDLR